jgi:hypothetical protein
LNDFDREPKPMPILRDNIGSIENAPRGSMRPRFDPSINLGNLLALAGLLLMLWQMNNGVIARLASIETKVELMWSAFQLTAKGR